MELQQAAISHGRVVPEGCSRKKTPNQGINAQGLLGRLVSWLGFGAGNIETTIYTTASKTTEYLSKESCFKFLSEHRLKTTGNLLDRATFMSQTDDQIINAVQSAFESISLKQDPGLQNYYVKNDAALVAFYNNKGIVTGKEPIQVDLDTLGLNLDETEEMLIWKHGLGVKPYTLRTAAQDVIDEINEQIKNSHDSKSIKEKRLIQLFKSEDPIKQYSYAGYPGGLLTKLSDDERNKYLWMNRIIRALIDKGHIAGMIVETERGYGLQA